MKIVHSSAVIIDEYRYKLERIWSFLHPKLVVGMLNPSTADKDVNDPTISFLIEWAFGQGFGGIHVVNEKAFRSSSPAIMMLEDDPRGPLNPRYMDSAMAYAKETSGVALAAWGNGCDGRLFIRMAKKHGVRMICLGTTQSGAPKHPMARGVHRIPRDQKPITWSPA